MCQVRSGLISRPLGELTLAILGMQAEIYLDNLRQETEKGKK